MKVLERAVVVEKTSGWGAGRAGRMTAGFETVREQEGGGCVIVGDDPPEVSRRRGRGEGVKAGSFSADWGPGAEGWWSITTLVTYDAS